MLIGVVSQWAPGSPSCPSVHENKDKSRSIVLSKTITLKHINVLDTTWLRYLGQDGPLAFHLGVRDDGLVKISCTLHIR